MSVHSRSIYATANGPTSPPETRAATPSRSPRTSVDCRSRRPLAGWPSAWESGHEQQHRKHVRLPQPRGAGLRDEKLRISQPEESIRVEGLEAGVGPADRRAYGG